MSGLERPFRFSPIASVSMASSAPSSDVGSGFAFGTLVSPPSSNALTLSNFSSSLSKGLADVLTSPVDSSSSLASFCVPVFGVVSSCVSCSLASLLSPCAPSSLSILDSFPPLPSLLSASAPSSLSSSSSTWRLAALVVAENRGGDDNESVSFPPDAFVAEAGTTSSKSASSSSSESSKTWRLARCSVCSLRRCRSGSCSSRPCVSTFAVSAFGVVEAPAPPPAAASVSEGPPLLFAYGLATAGEGEGFAPFSSLSSVSLPSRLPSSSSLLLYSSGCCSL
mmetsp:Transcript_89029/g.181513  ORF Transcript_89029/g.181513 Transcript_89029/m.181513 type:complete len:280 (-) Transcript_89029:863-1702(-)